MFLLETDGMGGEIYGRNGEIGGDVAWMRGECGGGVMIKDGMTAV